MSNEVVILGGTFDPFHQGHLKAVHFLCQRFAKVIIATTDQNPFKELKATDFWLRLEMITLVLSAEFIKFQLGGFPLKEQVYISDNPYRYAKDFVEHLSINQVDNIAWAVGPDLVKEVPTWKDWTQLNIPLVEVPEEINIRSVEIRTNRQSIHPVLVDFIEERKLYRA